MIADRWGQRLRRVIYFALVSNFHEGVDIAELDLFRTGFRIALAVCRASRSERFAHSTAFLLQIGGILRRSATGCLDLWQYG